LIIGVFSPTLHRIGGGEAVTVNMVNALKKAGYKTALSTMKDITQAKMLNTFGKKLNLDAQPIFPFNNFQPYSIHSLHRIALQSYALRLKCNVFIDTYSYSLFPWADIIYFQSRKFINPYKLEDISSKKKKIFLLSYSSLLKLLGKESKFKILLANSQFMAEIVNKYVVPNLSNVSTYTLYPPVDTEYFSPNKTELVNSERDGVVAFSRITPEKNLQIVPQIAKLTDTDTRFVIAGSCHSYKYLSEIKREIKKCHVSDRVKIMTNLTNAQVRNLLLKSKVYLHTATNEPFGISIVEAMASGCIPVVADFCGPREFVPEKFRYKSLEEAATKIEKTISEWSVERSNEMGIIANNFDVKEFSKNFLNILEANIHNFV
jgi:alpha-1,2-mannosyltransferase